MAEQEIQIVMRITTGISLWTAIKLRIAGRVIDKIAQEILIKIKAEEV